MTLPPHVLHLARKRLLDRSRSSSLLPSDADGNGDGLIDGADADADAEDDLYAAADGGRRRAAADATACDGQGKNKPKRVEPRKIGREEMRDRIDGFLLEDEREG